MVGKFVILFLALCAFQSAHCKVLRPSATQELLRRQQVRAILDDIFYYAHQMIDHLDDKLTEINKDGNAVIDKIKEMATSASQNVTNVVDTGISLIQAAAQEVINNGMDATKCLGTVIEGLEDLKGSTINDLTKCSTDRLAKVRQILDDSIAILKGYLNEARGYITQAEDCQGGWFCLSKVLASASLAAVKIPIQVAYEITKCNGQMALEIAALVSCAASEIKELAFIVGENVADTTKCLIGMITP